MKEICVLGEKDLCVSLCDISGEKIVCLLAYVSRLSFVPKCRDSCSTCRGM